MLTIDHLGTSPPERILWLCGEMVPHERKCPERDPTMVPTLA
jgi:hypothetical protein